MILRYREFLPSPRLSRHIECFWCHQSEEREPLYRVLPDGCTDIIFERPASGTPMLKIAGTMTRARTFDIPAQHFTLGLRFHPAMATQFLRLPGAEFLDRVIPLDEVWGRKARCLADQLSESESVRDCIVRLEAGLDEALGLGPAEKAISWLVASRGHTSVQALASAASLSPRQFRRICFERTGLPPKRLARILRFRHAVAHANPETRADWAMVALECGYYDQAHLINDFREFSGFAPGKFADRTAPVV